jgi:hypothetical protein
VAGVVAACVVLAYPFYWNASLVQIEHMPSVYPRRADNFWTYVTGGTSPLVFRLYYNINGSDWRRVHQIGPRAPRPEFSVEIPLKDLREGPNDFELRAVAIGRPSEEHVLSFQYDASPVDLPLEVDWNNIDRTDLDSQDGRWETFRSGNEWRVGPQRGYESYDRILAVTGAFADGRRVETDVVFHNRVGDTEYGFGVLTMWGGHPETEDYRPRRGWIFGLAWYWDRYHGFGNEISLTSIDDGIPDWVNSYRNMPLEHDVKYRIRVETYPEIDAAGNHLRFRQRLWWWKDGSEPPETPLDHTDVEGATLPPGEYAVGLLAYNSVLDFGPVRVERIPPAVVALPEP